jgi:hypothetical protein
MNSKDKEQIEQAILKSQLSLIDDLFSDTTKTKSDNSKTSTEIPINIKKQDDESPIDKSVELSPTDGSDKSPNKSKKLKNRFKSKVNNDYKFDEYDNDYDDTYDKYYENI